MEVCFDCFVRSSKFFFENLATVNLLLFLVLVFGAIFFAQQVKVAYVKSKRESRRGNKDTIWCWLGSQLFKGETYLIVGLILFLGALLFLELFEASKSWEYLIKSILKVFKEFGIFFVIAGLVGVAIETKNAKFHFVKTLHLHSDFLEKLSPGKKKEFFVNTLKKAYKFKNYGVEEEFAKLATENYLPVFEDRYQRNYFVHRNYKKVDGCDLSKGFIVTELRGARIHYNKQPESVIFPSREMKYVNEYEFIKRLENYKSRMSFKNKADDAFNICCGEYEASWTNSAVKEEGVETFLSSEDEALAIRYFGKGGELNISVRDKKKEIVMDNPYIEFKKRKLILSYLDKKDQEICNILVLLDDFSIKIRFRFEVDIALNEDYSKNDYHFFTENEFFSYAEEPFSVAMIRPTQNVTLSINFEDLNLNSERLFISDVHFFSQAGCNPLHKELATANTYNVKKSGWFFLNQGLAFNYRIIKKKLGK